MQRLTLEQAKKLNSTMVTEDHLLLHAANVSAAMGAMAEHFGADPEEKEEWEAVGWLHDYDYEKYPEAHLEHTEKPPPRSRRSGTGRPRDHEPRLHHRQRRQAGNAHGKKSVYGG
jgi:hypothetical protein